MKTFNDQSFIYNILCFFPFYMSFLNLQYIFSSWYYVNNYVNISLKKDNTNRKFQFINKLKQIGKFCLEQKKTTSIKNKKMKANI